MPALDFEEKKINNSTSR